MYKTRTKNILFAAALLPLLFAGTASAKTMVGDYPIEHDTALEADTNGNGKNDRTSYYLNGALTFTAYDEDENGRPDLWFRYKNDSVDLELADQNGDGEPDFIAEVTPQEKAEVVFNGEAEGAARPFSGTLALVGLVAIAIVVYRFNKELIHRQISELKNRLGDLRNLRP